MVFGYVGAGNIDKAARDLYKARSWIVRNYNAFVKTVVESGMFACSAGWSVHVGAQIGGSWVDSVAEQREYLEKVYVYIYIYIYASVL
jgi:hypothetical protein